MLINEVAKTTKLTKKAIEYYASQGLISPGILENGYRDYSSNDLERLKQISVLRQLDISTEEILRILNDPGTTVLETIAVQKDLAHQRDLQKNAVLQELIRGCTYNEIDIELASIEQSRAITDRLLKTFPGVFGRFLCLHFAHFLNEPIRTEAQQEAYETVITFLDNLPDFNIPEDLVENYFEMTMQINTEGISKMLEQTQKAYQNPEDFLEQNKEILRQYWDFTQSDEYLSSPVARVKKLMMDFNSSHGYNEIFIPAMKELSPSYAAYYQDMEKANKVLLEKYPELRQEGQRNGAAEAKHD